jgi:hypothetical protein
VPGAATAIVDVSGPSGIIASKSSAITLVNTVTSVIFPKALGLYGAAEPFNFVIANTSSTAMNNMSYQLIVTEGSVQRVVASGALPCVAGQPGTVAAGQSCVVEGKTTLTNSTGTGTLTGGNATITLKALQGSTVFRTKDAPILLLDGRFTASDVNPKTMVIDGPTASFTGTFLVAQPVLTSVRMTIQGKVEQGALVHNAGNVLLNCNNNGPQLSIPMGFFSCALTGDLKAANDNGNVTLTAGPAKLVVSGLIDNGSNANIVDTVTIPITLATAGTPPNDPPPKHRRLSSRLGP